MADTNERRNDRRGGRRDERTRAGRDNRRDERKAQAVSHTAEMHDRFANEIERSAKGATFYDAAPKPKDGAAAVVPTVSVIEQDSVGAVLELGRGIASACDLAVLDFASFTYPGGGYDRGTMAQEESLCAESFLYNVLKQFGGWYAENRRRNINCELYRDRVVVVPKVRFERDRFHSYADVIVASAPNARRARAEYHVDAKTLERSMRSRIRLVLGIADQLGHDKLLLGAFGCGVFGWDAGMVARMFREELASGTHAFSQVTFAVPKGRHDENLEHFQHAFAKFPEENSDPYVSRAAAAEAKAKAEVSQAEAPDDDDEGEDDWRKYL